MGSVGGLLQGKVVIKEATFSYGQRKLDYNRHSTVPIMSVRGVWHRGHPHDHYSSSYFFDAQPLSVEFILSQPFVDKLIDECYRSTGLDEVHDVKLENMVFSFDYHHDHQDHQTFQVTITGTGYHSKVMWEASPFVVKRHTSPVTCAMLRDILIEHVGLDIGEYPRK